MAQAGLNAVITGGASGIGLAMAQDMIARGGRVLVADFDEDALAKAASLLEEGAEVMRCDISRASEVDALLARAIETMDGIDLVFANAGLSLASPLLKATEEEFDLQFGANVKGAWLTAKAFAGHWRAEKTGGRICITGSEHSLGFQHAGAGLYTATKHAVLGLADVLRHELPETVSVSVFCPGLVSTGISQGRRKAGLGAESPGSAAFSQAFMARGMAPEEAAARAIDGVLRGDFIIVTHAVARDGAEQRWREMDAAFSEQAPAGSDPENWKVSEIIAEIRAKSSGI